MSDGIEESADIITGGLFARVVGPRAGEVHSDHASSSACLNCGTAMIGSYRHACGQAAHVHRTAGAILHDLAHGVFHFEGKARHTLPMLVRQPGALTRRYIDGERTRFVSPLALFLFTVFLMFAIVANLPGFTFGDGNFLNSGVTGGLAEAREKVSKERAAAEKQIAGYMRDIAQERADAEPNADRLDRLERRLKVARDARHNLTQAEAMLPVLSTADVADAPATDPDNWVEAKFRHAKENPKLLLYKLKTSAYKFSWALIPLSIPFLRLLFPFSRRFGLYDHAVFTTYSLTFMSLLTIVLAILSAVGVTPWMLVSAGIIIPPFHIYKQMKGTYGLGRTSALIRTTLLVALIVSAITPAFALVLLYLGLA